MTTYTADEIKANNLKVMGGDLGEKYSALWQDVAHLHGKWGKYCSLYGDTPEKVTVLNKVAPELFHEIERALWRDILIHIARLTDPPKMRHRETLTLKQLPTIVSSSDSSRIDLLVQDVMNKAAFCRDWRNREIAHNDLPHSLDNSVAPLAPASRLKVREVLNAIAAVLNAVADHYHKSETLFDSLIDSRGGDSLIWYLRKGIEKREEERRAKLGPK